MTKRVKMTRLVLALTGLTVLLTLSQIAYALYPTATPWPMYRHDLTRSGYTTSTAPNNNNTVWTSASSSMPYPIVAEGMVIYNSYNTMIAVDETTGVELWRSSGLTGTLTGPVYADGIVYFGSSSGYLYALNESTGVKLWEYQATTTGVISTAPAVANGKVYFGATETGPANYLYAIDASSGAYRWRYGGAALGAVYSIPAVDGTWIYFGADDNKVRALNDTGIAPSLRWTYTTNGRVRCTPAIGQGLIFFSAYYPEYSLFAVDKLTGQHVWKYTMSKYGENSPAFYDGIVYYTNYHNYKVYALYANATPGVNYTETDPAIRKWSTTVGYYPSSPVVADGKVFLGAYYTLYALDTSDGQILWTYTFPYGAGEPIVADGRLFAPYYYGVVAFGSYYPPVTYDYPVSVASYDFNVRLVIANATPGQLGIGGLISQKKISYSLNGISGTRGMSNITIPNAMLGGPYTITVDGGLPDYQAPPLDNGTHTSLYFTYAHSIHTVEITGTTVIPEFPPSLILPLFMMMTLLVAIAYKRKRPPA